MNPCQHTDCNKPSISFSKFCGEHTDNEIYAKALNGLPSGEYAELFISEVELEGVHLANMTWFDCTIEDCVLSESSFKKIVFKECTLRDSVFNATEFLSGGIEEDSIIASVSFFGCKFQEFYVQRTSLSNTYFQDDTDWVNGSWRHLQLANVDFLNASVHGLDIMFCVFDHCSIQDSDMHDLVADEVKLKVSFTHNSRFDRCHLKQFETDMQDLDVPISICVFKECSIDRVLNLGGFHEWNGVNVEETVLYYRLLDRIEGHVHVDNLSPLQDVVQRLYKKHNAQFEIALQLQRILVKYFEEVKKSGDLGGLGTIVNTMSRLPQDLILDKSQYLPTPSSLPDRNVLRIEMKKDISDLDELTRAVTSMNQFTKAIEDSGFGSIVLEDIRKGSITFVISAPLTAIILIVWLLYQAGYLYLNVENMMLTNRQLKKDKKTRPLENLKLQQEIELNNQQKKLNEQQLMLNELEIERRQKERREQNLPEKYINTTPEEVSNLTNEDPFDRLELKPLNALQKAADDILDLGETNIYIEIIANEIKDNTEE